MTTACDLLLLAPQCEALRYTLVARAFRSQRQADRYCSVLVCNGYYGHYLCSAVPLNFQFHDMSNVKLITAKSAELITAKSVECIAGCLHKLPLSLLETCVSYRFSTLQAYCHCCLSFQCCNQVLKSKLATKSAEFCTAQSQNENRAVLPKAIASVIT